MTTTPPPPDGYTAWIDYTLRERLFWPNVGDPVVTAEDAPYAYARAELSALRAERDEALKALVIAQDLMAEVVNQACTPSDAPRTLDSCASSTYADALRYLAKISKVEIVTDVGRRVIARVKA